MERYYNKDDDDDEEPFFGSDDEDDDDDEDGETVAFIDQQGIIDVMQLDLAQTDLNQKLLDRAMKIAKQSWWWYFKSAETKVKEIEEIYKRLLRLTEKPEDKEE